MGRAFVQLLARDEKLMSQSVDEAYIKLVVAKARESEALYRAALAIEQQAEALRALTEKEAA